MKSNSWNLRGAKERLEILERTQAHKRHLISVLSAKTSLNTHCSLSARQPHSPISLFRKKVIADDNRNLARKIASLSRGSPQRLNSSVCLSRSLKAYSSVNRSMRQRQIEVENSRMLSRLVTAAPTLKRQQWAKSNQLLGKYKENLHRSKYKHPDYSQEACRILSRQPKFKCLRLVPADPKSVLHKKTKIV